MTRNTDYKVYAADGTHDITKMTSLSERKKRGKKNASRRKNRRGGAKVAGEDKPVADDNDKPEKTKKKKGHGDHKVDYYA